MKYIGIGIMWCAVAAATIGVGIAGNPAAATFLGLMGFVLATIVSAISASN